jgi:hypothetical protein
MLRPDLVRRRRWISTVLGSPVGIAACFAVAPAAIVALGSASLAERIQVAGGYQLVAGFFGLLAGAWAGERSADTWHWLIIYLTVDLMLGAGAVALAATPMIALEVLALGMDLTRLGRKVVDVQRPLMAVDSMAMS